MKMKLWSSFAAVMGLTLAGYSAVGAQAPAAARQETKDAKIAAESALSPNGPWIGTWKRNPQKSGGTAMGTATMKMWVEGDGFRYQIEMAPPSGSGAVTHMTAFGRFDGKQYPEKGNSSADFNVFKRLDERTYSLDDIKDGKVTHHFTVTISADGKTRTSVAVTHNAQGEEVTNIGVWDRVK